MSATSDRRKRDLGMEHYDDDVVPWQRDGLGAVLPGSDVDRGSLPRRHAPEREASGQTPPWAHSDDSLTADAIALDDQYSEGYQDGLLAAASIAAARNDSASAKIFEGRAEAVRRGLVRLHDHAWHRDPDTGRISCSVHAEGR